MPNYNTKFDLTPDDMDVIEEALRETKTKLTTAAIDANDSAAPDLQKAKKIRDLLGRLHNQKVFYRPKTGAYISG